MSQCVAIQDNGKRCGILLIGTEERCKKHMQRIHLLGPNATARKELRAKLQADLAIVRDEYFNRPVELRDDPAQLTRYHDASKVITLRYDQEKAELELRIVADTRANGNIDRDQPARMRAHQRDMDRRMARIEWAAARAQERQAALNRYHLAAERVLENNVGDNQLRNFANDRQNVHTAVVVQQVQETVRKILEIPVPQSYAASTLQTPGEIMLECKLSREAALQMMRKYSEDENIYELGNGIYAKVLNAVWQFIKSSPNSADLKNILAVEMTDNIGMCAQGNLSRLCNILSGYMDGLKVNTKSKNEIVGELLALLMNVEDEGERISRANAILSENEIPIEERNTWLEPLVEA